jgi:hypothetical protein
MEITTNGRMTLFTEPGEKAKKVIGQIIDVQEDPIEHDRLRLRVTAFLDHDPTTGYHRVMMELWTTRKDKTEEIQSLGGTYVGSMERLRRPQTGRIFLHSISEKHAASFQETSFQQPSTANKMSKGKEALLPFFGGLNPDVSDGAYQLNACLMERTLYLKIHAGRGGHKKYDGSYFLFYPNTKGDIIYRRILRIATDKSLVEWVDANETDYQVTLFGAAALIGKSLTLRFNEVVEKQKNKPLQYKAIDRLISFPFKDGDHPPIIGDVIDGMVYRQNTDGNPMMTTASILKINPKTLNELRQPALTSFAPQDLIAQYPMIKNVLK